MKKLPDKVKIAYETLNIRELSQKQMDRKSLHPPDQLAGCYSFEDNEICLEKTQLPCRKARYLLHEIIHAMCNRLWLEKELEERIVIQLEEKFTMLIRDNPKLIKHFMEVL